MNLVYEICGTFTLYSLYKTIFDPFVVKRGTHVFMCFFIHFTLTRDFRKQNLRPARTGNRGQVPEHGARRGAPSAQTRSSHRSPWSGAWSPAHVSRWQSLWRCSQCAYFARAWVRSTGSCGQSPMRRLPSPADWTGSKSAYSAWVARSAMRSVTKMHRRERRRIHARPQSRRQPRSSRGQLRGHPAVSLAAPQVI